MLPTKSSQVSKVNKFQTKVSVVLSSEFYNQLKEVLVKVATTQMFTPKHTFFFEMMRINCANLVDTKFSKMVRLGEKNKKITLNHQEAITFFFCLKLYDVPDYPDFDVLKFLIRFLSDVALEELIEMIKQIKEYWNFAN